MKKTNNKGFSLIELIIVIAIMAVLVAIIAPNLTKYLGSSKSSADKKNLDEISSTLNTCITDFEMSNSTLLADSTANVVITWAADGNTGKSTFAGTNVATTELAKFEQIVDSAIDAGKCQSKENSSKWAKATITKDATTNSYEIEVVFPS